MTGQFDIRATPARPLPILYNVGMTFLVAERESGSEEKVLAWMPRETLEEWGLKWQERSTGIDPAAAVLLARLGLETILRAIENDEELPGEVPVRREELGGAMPPLRKECAYQQERELGLFCTVSAMEDPHGGQTSKILCDTCHMPDRVLICSDMQSPRTAWYPDDTDHGARDLMRAVCRSGNDPGTGILCLPGEKECWVKTVRAY